MTEIEKGLFLRLFNRGGYVLNFTTSSFDTFTKSSIGVALCAHYGLSKGRSLTKYIEEESDVSGTKLLCDLFDYYEAQPEYASEMDGTSTARDAKNHHFFMKSASPLRGENEQASPFSPNVRNLRPISRATTCVNKSMLSFHRERPIQLKHW